MTQQKNVCFAGHRNKWQIKCDEEKLQEVVENLINNGYTDFYDGNMGYFDYLCKKTVVKLKEKYPHIKLIKVLTYYQHEKDKFTLPEYYDDTVFPFTEEYHFKQRIIKRNEWIVDTCEVLVCHIRETYKSGAYRTVKYA